MDDLKLRNKDHVEAVRAQSQEYGEEMAEQGYLSGTTLLIETFYSPATITRSKVKVSVSWIDSIVESTPEVLLMLLERAVLEIKQKEGISGKEKTN